jgi:hypothetical protein
MRPLNLHGSVVQDAKGFAHALHAIFNQGFHHLSNRCIILVVGYCYSSFRLVIWLSPTRRTEMAHFFNTQNLATLGEEMNLQKRSYTTLQKAVKAALKIHDNNKKRFFWFVFFALK